MESGVKIYGEIALLSGSANPELSQHISKSIGVPLLDVDIRVFENENIFVQLKESVRSRDVFIIQPTCSPVHYNIMELLILLDTVRRASAGRVTAITPYFAYARSDKKDMPRVPITAKLVADMIEVAGADRFMCVDLHAGQIQGFFQMPGDELSALPIITEYFKQKELGDLVVVAADLGFAKKARNVAQQLHAPVAFIEKRRTGDATESLTVIGDVQGKNVLMVDDEVDRATTMAGAAKRLHEVGANKVYAGFIHATFSGDALERLGGAGFEEIVCTNTEPIPNAKLLPNLRVIDLGPWLGDIIMAVHSGQSVGRTIQDYVPRFTLD